MPPLLFELAWAYAAVGGVAAVAFLALGLDRVDAAARGSYAFRPLIVPGLMLLWPLVLWRWGTLARNASPSSAPVPTWRAAHRGIWLVLAFVLPLLFVSALALHRQGPREAAPVRLSAPDPAPQAAPQAAPGNQP